MYRCLITVLSCLLGAIALQGQNVVTSAGGTYQSDTYSLEWSIGETIISTLPADSLFLTQGFNQPMIICSPCEEDLTEQFPFESDENEHRYPIRHRANINEASISSHI